jgi:hypothetical protein
VRRRRINSVVVVIMGNNNSVGSSVPNAKYAAQVIPQIEENKKKPVILPNDNRQTRVYPTDRVYRSETYVQNKRVENDDRLLRYASGNPKSGWKAMTTAPSAGSVLAAGDAKLAYETQTAASKKIIESLSATSADKYAKSLSLKSKSMRFTKYDPVDSTRKDLGVLAQGPIPSYIKGLDPGKIDAIQGEKERLAHGTGQVYTAGGKGTA